MGPPRTYWSTHKRLIAVASCAVLIGCADLLSQATSPSTGPVQDAEKVTLTEPQTPPVPDIGTELYHRADAERVQALEREVERLKTDLIRAEDALITVESRLRSGHSRANAVSSLAEAQMQLNKASEIAPWRSDIIKDARDKLDIAQKHIDNEYFGAAVFFVYRANRIVEELNYEASIVGKTSEVMFINRPRVNLRAGPSTDEGAHSHGDRRLGASLPGHQQRAL